MIHIIRELISMTGGHINEEIDNSKKQKKLLKR
jgi:hypothetical protein